MKNKVIIITEVILLLGTIGLFIFNLLKNESFLIMSASQGITLFVAIALAFWAAQTKNKQQNQKEHAEKLLGRIQEIVSEECFYKISEESDTKKISMLNRKMSNSISVLKQYASILGFEEEIEYIEKEFKEYKTFTGDKIGDLDYLSKSEDTLLRHSENICSKCDFIILRLYK